MTATEIITRAGRLGLHLEPRSGRLWVAPVDRCPPEFLELLRSRKPEVLRLLSGANEPGWRVIPPESLPLAWECPTPTPEERADMVEYLIRQGCGKPGQLTAWLVRRENAYYDGPGRHWDCHVFSYAAARDAACWQLNRSEADVIKLLVSTRMDTTRIEPRQPGHDQPPETHERSR